MKRLIIIETAVELFQFARRERQKGDDTPSLPLEAKVVFTKGYKEACLSEAPGFELDNHITVEQIIVQAFSLCDLIADCTKPKVTRETVVSTLLGNPR